MEVNTFARLPFLLLLASTADLIAGFSSHPTLWTHAPEAEKREWSLESGATRPSWTIYLPSGFLYSRETGAPAVFMQSFYATKTNFATVAKWYPIAFSPFFCTPTQMD